MHSHIHTVDDLLAENTPLLDSNSDAIAQKLQNLINLELKPKVKDIDEKGEYPKAFLQHLGAIGGFQQSVPKQYGGAGHQGLKFPVQMIEAISQECLNTGFISWCQFACTWYLQNSDNEYLLRNVLPKVANAQILAGTGLSNPMKHFAGIEKIALVAQQAKGGYLLNGTLPWVSNIGSEHYFAIAAQMVDSDDYLMAIVTDSFPGLTLRCKSHFIALEGSNTYTCVFKDVFVPDTFVLAAPSTAYVEQIKAGFVLTQVGMGLGLVASCIELMQEANKRLDHVNCFLDDCVEDLENDLESLRLHTYILATEIHQGQNPQNNFFKEVVQARATASELALRTAQSAMLHLGAKAYLEGSTVSRKLREAYFVAIVTPALKHLRKLLSQMKDISSS
ncbi:acyl-CoA dehydrogenase family protein [Gloeocapsopsis dulcis]|uniref:Acyl-CoA dehydrogenase n=1 Tax=Gloeocapsopsis dulcis AAB1 = 1H9 TaxID=1433147 RepID=A0A6N8FYN4_9CHRO|nr:acyl-CoA dehydrogenase family protein [Gloeocapsopsis dulcis]MUL37959.1 acyl-CoA dehydrogenase [Gloeocapsopsis dulcis AAB1 = 1H9]WNN87352.1 acyl-CoA/acyl-ACP dehydrogenase [Gloeocapsopsis dulcis]